MARVRQMKGVLTTDLLLQVVAKVDVMYQKGLSEPPSSHNSSSPKGFWS